MIPRLARWIEPRVAANGGHSGFRLLYNGLDELKPEAQRAAGIKGLVGSSRASLHGKTFVLDRTSVFIGSVNIDPRSLEHNTEVGKLGHASRPSLLWVATQDGRPVQFTSEPFAGFWRRLGARVFSHLPIESLI